MSQLSPHSDGQLTGRVVAFDWLRIITITLVVCSHGVSLFSGDGAALADGSERTFLEAGLVRLGLWRMPLLFLIAGVSVEGMRRTVGTAGVLRNRLRRLLIPAISCLLLVRPSEALIHEYWHSGTPVRGSAFVDALDSTLRSDGGPAWGHLWFLPTLLLVSLACALGLRTRAGHVLADKCAAGLAELPRVSSHVALASLLALLVCAPNRLSAALQFIPGSNHANPLPLGACYIIGVLLARRPAILHGLTRDRWATLVATALLVIAADATRSFAASQPHILPTLALAGGRVRLATFAPALIEGTALWLGLAATLGFALTHLREASGFLRYARDGVFVIYLLHQPLLMGGAFVTRRLELTGAARLTVIVLIALVASTALYEFALRRWRATRFAFGIPDRAATCVSLLEVARQTYEPHARALRASALRAHRAGRTPSAHDRETFSGVGRAATLDAVAS